MRTCYLIRLLICIAIITTLSSCASFQGYLRYSANQKLIDSKGFKGKKRMPMHNKKYITKAKNNLATSNTKDVEEDDEGPQNQYYEPDELRDYYKSNRKMYNDMVEMNNNKRYWNKNFASKSKPEVTLKQIDQENKKQEETKKIKSELEEIKKMLKKTMDDLASSQSNKTLKPSADKSLILDSLLEPNAVSGPCSAPQVSLSNAKNSSSIP